jgi:hypothetical protein
MRDFCFLFPVGFVPFDDGLTLWMAIQSQQKHKNLMIF